MRAARESVGPRSPVDEERLKGITLEVLRDMPEYAEAVAKALEPSASELGAQQPTDEDGDTVMSVVERLEDEICAPLTSMEREELMAVHEALEGRRPDVA